MRKGWGESQVLSAGEIQRHLMLLSCINAPVASQIHEMSRLNRQSLTGEKVAAYPCVPSSLERLGMNQGVNTAQDLSRHVCDETHLQGDSGRSRRRSQDTVLSRWVQTGLQCH